jgi:hypothetical protein
MSLLILWPLIRGIFFLTGPLLLLLATIFELIQGNFLNMMMCGFFCVFWSSLGIIQLPTADIAASYSATGNAAEGALSHDFNAGVALYLLSLGCAVFSFFILTLKTNLALATLFANTTAAIFMLSDAFWNISNGDLSYASKLKHVSVQAFQKCASAPLTYL